MQGDAVDDAGPVVRKVHNVLAFPIRFGRTPTADCAEDPFMDYASSDSNHVGADESVFGVIKVTNRLAERPKGKKLQLQRLQRASGRRGQDDRYMPFRSSDVALLEAWLQGPC